MAFTTKVRFIGEASGSGDDRKVAGFSTLTIPTQVSGPIRQVITSAGQAIEVGSLISGEMKGLFVEAVVSGVYVNPFSINSAMVTCGCYISQGDFNYYSFQTTTSVLPSATPESSRAEIDVWYVGVS